MFDSTVPAISRGSCGTNDVVRRQSASAMSPIGRPSIVIEPAAGGRSRRSSWTSVDFPLPDGPITPTISPGSMRKLTPSSAGTRGP